MKPRFRKEINFGLGFKVPVFGRGKMTGMLGCYNMLPEATIELDATRPIWEQCRTYAHEILHAAIDFQHYVERDIVEPMKAEVEETKRQLAERDE